MTVTQIKANPHGRAPAILQIPSSSDRHRSISRCGSGCSETDRSGKIRSGPPIRCCSTNQMMAIHRPFRFLLRPQNSVHFVAVISVLPLHRHHDLHHDHHHHRNAERDIHRVLLWKPRSGVLFCGHRHRLCGRHSPPLCTGPEVAPFSASDIRSGRHPRTAAAESRSSSNCFSKNERTKWSATESP